MYQQEMTYVVLNLSSNQAIELEFVLDQYVKQQGSKFADTTITRTNRKTIKNHLDNIRQVQHNLDQNLTQKLAANHDIDQNLVPKGWSQV